MGEHSMPPGSPSKRGNRPSKGRALLEFVGVVVVALILAYAITNYVVRPYAIPSASMEDTIDIGDRVLSEKISYYSGEPEQGQIVTFKDVDDPDKTLIKRVIAVAGQTVDLPDGEHVSVDGEIIDEPYTDGRPSMDLYSGIEYPFTVPEGCIWVMGDNRTDSADSRDFGPVPVENVTGHAFARYWPLSRIGMLE